MTFRYGHAVNRDWSTAVDSIVAQLGGDRGSEGLGFVYIADQLGPHADAVLRRLRERTGVTEWVGYDCPDCMKAILDSEWQEHRAWHGLPPREPDYAEDEA